MTTAPLPANDPRAFRRLEAADHRARNGDYRAELRAAIAKLQPDVLRRRAELAADEDLLARKVAELVILDEHDEKAVAAFAPLAPLFISLKEAAALAGCSRVTMRRLCERHGFGWCRDGHWRVSRDELMVYLANVGPVEEPVLTGSKR